MSKRKLIFANNPLLAGPALDERGRSSGGTPYKEIPVSAIVPDPNQPRREFDEEKLNELADSIRLYGVLSPILVRQGRIPGKFDLIAGERRFRAAQRAGLSAIPAIVNADDEEGRDILSIQLVENLQRADLSSLERAHAIGALRDGHDLSVREIGERLSISKSAVQRSLEILELPDDLLNALREGASESKVLLLARIEDPEIRASYLKDLDVLTRSQLAKDLESSAQKKETPANEDRMIDPEDRRIAEEMQRALGTKVRLSRSAPGSGSGRVVIDFYSETDLQEIFRKIVAV
jgi:ParB family transcriptional regulator, chromosome partitioning protein